MPFPLPLRARPQLEGAFTSGASGALLLASLWLACAVDLGENFQVAEVVYEQSYFYCQVEPMLFSQHCGGGDASLGESAQGCHFNRQRLRLTDYAPLAAEQCVDGRMSDVGVPEAARQNYQSAQLQMEVDPERSPLLLRPTSDVAHPRIIFEPDSAEAEIIRAWSSRYSSR
jgi:hypothetical protein